MTIMFNFIELVCIGIVWRKYSWKDANKNMHDHAEHISIALEFKKVKIDEVNLVGNWL